MYACVHDNVLDIFKKGNTNTLGAIVFNTYLTCKWGIYKTI